MKSMLKLLILQQRFGQSFDESISMLKGRFTSEQYIVSIPPNILLSIVENYLLVYIYLGVVKLLGGGEVI